jgi:predicted permease
VGLAAGLAVVWALDLEPLLGGALALQMAMPCAVVSYMYTKRYAPTLGDTAAGAVLASTVVFLLLAPLMLWFSHGQ